MARPQHTGSESDTETQEGSEFEFLGMLVAVVDYAAGDFVYGPLGTPGRPDGVTDVAFLASMDSGRLLSASGHRKWMQFLHVWETAGWSLQRVLQVTDELRPLQHGSDLEMADLAGVQAEQLDRCIADYCGTQSQIHDMLKEFLAIVQANFSYCDSVLWPAEDASKRMSMIELPEQNQSLSA